MDRHVALSGAEDVAMWVELLGGETNGVWLSGQPVTVGDTTYILHTPGEVFISEALDLVGLTNHFFKGLITYDLPEDYSPFPVWWAEVSRMLAGDAMAVEVGQRTSEDGRGDPQRWTKVLAYPATEADLLALHRRLLEEKESYREQVEQWFGEDGNLAMIYQQTSLYLEGLPRM